MGAMAELIFEVWLFCGMAAALREGWPAAESF
jgi:hypothetical protein